MSFINYDVKIQVTPEESKLIQEICFKNGLFWVGGMDTVSFNKHPYLYIYTNNGIKYGESESHFAESTLPEVLASDFIITYGTMDFEKYNIKQYTHGKVFEIIEPTTNSSLFITSLNKIYEKYQNHTIDVLYSTTTNNGFIYKSALVTITPKNGLNF